MIEIPIWAFVLLCVASSPLALFGLAILCVAIMNLIDTIGDRKNDR